MGTVEGLDSFALKGDDLRTYLRRGIVAVRDLVDSTYGPRGLDKLVTVADDDDGVELIITNDGYEVLHAIERGDGYRHPVTAIVVDAIDTMHRSLNDGASVVALLTASLYTRGEDLLNEGLSPREVILGYSLAADRAGQVLDDLARSVSADDRRLLTDVASTTIGHGIDAGYREQYAEMAVRAVQGLAAGDESLLDTDRIKVVTAADADVRLHEGVILTRWPLGLDRADRSKSEFDWEPAISEPIADVTVAILDAKIDVEATATNFGEGDWAGVQLDDMAAFDEYRRGYERAIAGMAEGVADMGVDILVSKPRVDDELTNAFEARGVTVIEPVETPEADIDRLARATGATVVSRPEDLTPARLGRAGSVVERRQPEEKWTVFASCPGTGIYTLELSAPTKQSATRYRRTAEAATDAVAIATMDGQVIPGAGASQLAVSSDLQTFADGVTGKRQLAVTAFAEALDDTVRQLAANAGLDSVDAITTLRASHAAEPGRASIGLDLGSGAGVDAWELGVVEPRRTLSQAIETARTLAGKFISTDAMVYPKVELADYQPQTEHD